MKQEEQGTGDARQSLPRNAVAVAPLREVSALRAVRRASDPLGRSNVERQAYCRARGAPSAAQGPDDSASGMGGRTYRVRAVSD